MPVISRIGKTFNRRARPPRPAGENPFGERRDRRRSRC